MIDFEQLFARRPKTLFLVDSLGAFTTAFFLFAILRPFNQHVGIPQLVLTYLSIIALLFCFYSMTCFLLIKNNWQPFLKIISIANLLYCCLTIGIVVYYYHTLTILGVAYFLVEIVIVFGLVFVELKTVSK